MNGRPWTPEDVETLRRLAETLPQREACKVLGRSKYAVSIRARKEGIKFRVRAGAGPHAGEMLRPWTRAEVLELWKWAGEEPAWRIAQRLGRTTSAVINKAQKLGVRLSVPDGVASVARYLDVSSLTVARHRDKLGQRWRLYAGRRTLRHSPPEPEDIAAIARSIVDEPRYGGSLRASLRRLQRIAEGDAP
jgi:hypothetical protein